MPSDFTVFHAHLAEACRDRKKAPDPLCAAAVDLHFAGVRALDVYRLAKLADELDVSVDWLLGRSDMMGCPSRRQFGSTRHDAVIAVSKPQYWPRLPLGSDRPRRRSP